MSAISFRNVWVEYGDQVVLERINLDIATGNAFFRSSARPAPARARSCG